MPETDAPLINREKIAKTVTIFVLAMVGLILICALLLLLFLKDDAKATGFSHFKDIISMVLPLLGTWIGTVLAYYFAKDNFDAANKNVKDLVSMVTADQKLKGIKANDKDVLIPLAEIKFFKYTTKDEMAKVKLLDIIKFMAANNVLRLPMLDTNNVLKFCIHRSIYDKFISLEAINEPDKKAADLTFDNFLNTPFDEIKNYIKSGSAFLKEDATLYDVKLIMDHNKFCQDVFLTKSGNADEPISGWITDGKILEKSKV